MNYIGLDLSIASSAMYIMKDDGTELYFVYKNNSKLSKWHKKLSFINYRDYKLPKIDSYSDTEILKIFAYDKITDNIIEDMLNHVDPENTIISVEGYNYGTAGNTSSIIDLVTYSTLLRTKILKHDFVNFIVIPPTSLKSETAKRTYIPIRKIINKGKTNERIEYTYKNKLGIAGGNFTKHDMLDAIMDNAFINNNLKQALKNDHNALQLMKSIPKPIDDMIDACWLVLINLLKEQH